MKDKPLWLTFIFGISIAWIVLGLIGNILDIQQRHDCVDSGRVYIEHVCYDIPNRR